MGKKLITHKLIGFDRFFDIIFVNAQGNPHKHMPWPFHNLSIEFEEVGFFEGFEAEVVHVVVSGVDYLGIYDVGELLDKGGEGGGDGGGLGCNA